MLFSCMKGVVGYCIILGTLVSCKPMLLSNWFSHVWRKVGAGWLSRHAVWEKHRNTWGPKMADPTTIDFYPLNNIKHYSFWMVQWFMVLVYSHLPIAMTWRKSLGGVLFDFPGFMTCSGAKVNWAARFGGANSCGGRVFQGVLGLWVFKAEDSRKPISAIGRQLCPFWVPIIWISLDYDIFLGVKMCWRQSAHQTPVGFLDKSCWFGGKCRRNTRDKSIALQYGPPTGHSYIYILLYV